jgi:hypothetical protein
MNADQRTVGGNLLGGAAGQKDWRVPVFVVLWILLSVQCVVDVLARDSGRYAYPTIAMPGFGAGQVDTHRRGRVTERQIQVIDAAGASHAITAGALLAPMPYTSATSTLDRIFDPSANVAPELSPETINYLRRQAEQLNLGAEPVGLRLVWLPEFLDIASLNRTSAGDATVREVRW